MKSFLVCKSTCASCSSNYIGKICCNFKARNKKHIRKDNNSHIFKHLNSTTTCFDFYNSLSFKIIDKTNSKFNLKIIKALQIKLKKPNLNTQQNHLGFTLSLASVNPLFYSVFVFLLFSFISYFHYLRD